MMKCKNPDDRMLQKKNTVVVVVFLFLHENIYYGYSLEAPRQAECF